MPNASLRLSSCITLEKTSGNSTTASVGHSEFVRVASRVSSGDLEPEQFVLSRKLSGMCVLSCKSSVSIGGESAVIFRYSLEYPSNLHKRPLQLAEGP